jgi:hypothetical protein
MTEAVRGSCLCGAVAFRIEGPYTTFQYCHCSRCRKSSGSAHAANLFVPVEQLHWERGEASVRRYPLPSAKRFTSSFCETCGAKMPWLPAGGTRWVVPAGALDDDPGEKPVRNIHFASRAPWYAHAKDLETHDTVPGK